MRVIVSPSSVRGEITAAAGKSAMQRACALALLHRGETVISNPGKSNDDLAALAIIVSMGAVISKNENGAIVVNSNDFLKQAHTKVAEKKTINCGESGLGIRMFTPIAALSEDEMIITGEGSLLNRPMHFFDEILPQLGVSVQSVSGKLPLSIKGPLQPRDITIDGSLSSQFLTGLLMAFASAAKEQVTITVNDLKSKPYTDLTLEMMRHFGYEVINENYEEFTIRPKTVNHGPQAYTVEGDWSGAAFLMVAGAIAGEVTVKGLDFFSTQADKAVLQALMMAGVRLSIEEKQVMVSAPAGGRGKAFHFNATDCPDLFPPLVALAAYCEGTSVIEGAGRLVHKESNRANSLKEEFGKMGIMISVQDDLMLVEGAQVSGGIVHSHHDHRIAMACAVAALKATAQTTIEEAGAVNKSYPGFYEDLKMLGANVSLP